MTRRPDRAPLRSDILAPLPGDHQSSITVVLVQLSRAAWSGLLSALTVQTVRRQGSCTPQVLAACVNAGDPTRSSRG